jgi:DNL zinc finger
MRIRIGHHCHGSISSSPVSWNSVQNFTASIVVGFVVGVTWLCWVVGMGVIVSSVASNSNSCNSNSNSRMRRSSGETTLAFVGPAGHPPRRLAPLAASSRTRRRNNDHHDNDDDDSNGDDSRYPTESAFRIPQLPPVGGATSSLIPLSLDEEQEMVGATETTTRPMVGRAKIQLQYTCTICDTRNVHTMSRLAYRHGVVIARCQQCQNQHWIADHLGWLSLETTTTASRSIHTIEDYFAQHSDKNVTVHRVTPDVFALEQILHASPPGTSTTSAMVGDDDNDDHGPEAALE